MGLEEFYKYLISCEQNNEFPSFDFLADVTTGYTDYAGLTATNCFWLAATPEGRRLFNHMADRDPAATLNLLLNCDLDVGAVGRLYDGQTAFWKIVNESMPFLNKLAHHNPAQTLALLHKVNLDAAPVSGIWQGETAFWKIVNGLESMPFLNKLESMPFLNKLAHHNPAQTLALLHKVNLDAAPVSGIDQGETAFWKIVNELESMPFLNKLAHHNPAQTLALLHKVNLDAAPVSGLDQGQTAFWKIVHTFEGMCFLNNLAHHNPAQTLALLHKVNLDAAPVSGLDQGQTVFWEIVNTPVGMQFLNKLAHHNLAQTLALLHKVNLDAAPISGIYKGQTAFGKIVDTPGSMQFLNNLVDHNPAQTLALLQKVNLGTVPVSGPNQGKIILRRLASEPEGRQLIKKCPALMFCYANLDQNVTDEILKEWGSSNLAESNAFMKLFILVGIQTAPSSSNSRVTQIKNMLPFTQAVAPPRLAPSIARRYNAMRKKLLNEIDNNIRLVWIEKNWPLQVCDAMQLNILHQYIRSEHPDLYFIDDGFLRLLVADRLAELYPNNFLRKLAMLCVRSYRIKHQNEPEFQNSGKVQAYQEIVSDCLWQVLGNYNIHPFQLDESCRILLIDQISNCASLNPPLVFDTINKAIVSYMNTNALSSN